MDRQNSRARASYGACSDFLRRQSIDRWGRYTAHAEHHIDLPAVMRLVLDHRAEPLADGDRRVGRRAAFLEEPSVTELGEKRTRFVVQAVVICDRCVEAIGEVAAVSWVCAATSMYRLRVQVPLDRGQVPNQIAEGELAGRGCPFEIGRRDLHDHATRAIMHT